MCALLIGGQFVFSFVAGVEIVTILLISFSCVFGARRGVILSVAFSLLRCLLFGFYPTVIILYLIYYPLLSTVFALLGKCENFTSKRCAVLINALLMLIAASCASLYFFKVIKVAKAYAVTVNIFLWVIFAVSCSLAAVYDIILFSKNGKKNQLLKLITLSSVGAVMTVIFTLLDDIITPLFWQYSRFTALAYFYSSFTAMLPQTVCTIVSILTLFLPLTELFKKLK